MPETDPRPGDRLKVAAVGLRSRASEKLGDLWWWFLLRGLLAGALGLAALVWPGTSLTVLAGLVGLYCLLDGLAGLVAALRGADSGTTWLTTLAGLAAGAVLLFWPGVTLRAFLMAFGAWALVTGASHIIAARGRREGEEQGTTVTLGVLVAVFGLVLVVWPGTGVVTIAWVIAAAAFVIAALLVFIALRLRRLQERLARA